MCRSPEAVATFTPGIRHRSMAWPVIASNAGSSVIAAKTVIVTTIAVA